MKATQTKSEILRELAKQPTQLNTRVPRWIIEGIDETAGKEKKTKASIVADALASYLADKGLSDPTIEPIAPPKRKPKA